MADLMEGVASEAASLAGHLQLDNLIYFYDNNHISIEGSTELAFTEDRGKRFEAYGWFVQKVADGNDLEAIDAAIRAAQAESGRPSLIMVRTHIGYGSPNKQDTAEAHGSPLGEEEVKLTKKNLGWPLEPAFLVPDEARTHFRLALAKGAEAEAEWQGKLEAYRQAFPDLAAEWDRYTRGELPGLAGEDSGFQPYRQADGDAPGFRQSLERHFTGSPHLAGRLGGSGALHQHPDQRRKGFSSPGVMAGATSISASASMRMAAILNGMALSGLISLWGDVLYLLRLSAAISAPGGANGGALDFCLHARQHFSG